MKKIPLKLFILLIVTGCNFNIIQAKKKNIEVFAKGADISWLPQMEKSGYQFYNTNGKAEDCFKILKNHGINSIRLRTWVNPSDDPMSGHCSRDETVEMAKRAKSSGMEVMIDFHYSDSWADPAKQIKPKAWENLDFENLKKALYDYTFDVMMALKTAGITPKWVQAGNEIPTGMIYPEGHTDRWPQLVQLINRGYDAIKAVSPTTKVILHVDQGNNNQRFRNWFDNATKYGAKYDVIGLSFYPYWLDNKPDYSEVTDSLSFNMNDMVTRYGKEVMVVEAGGEDNKAENTFNMLKEVIKITKSVKHNKGTGVFYWEPEGARSWSQYPLSCWGNDGKPTKALQAFK